MGEGRSGTETSRRRFLTGAAAAGVGAAAGFAAGYGVKGVADANAQPAAIQTAVAAEMAALADNVVPFYGDRQAGITTAQQERLMFASFDVTTRDVEELKRMLGRWAAMAARMTEGKLISESPTKPAQPPQDTGEALDLGAHSLTITVGFGPSLFDDRFGLADRMPPELAAFGTIPGDAVLRPELSDGDLCVQACADDPQVVFHAVRNLARAARGTATLRWSQLGFGRASSTGSGQVTPRNLMGFKDGTRNVRSDDTATLDAHVWVGGGPDSTQQIAPEHEWMRGGSYLVARKIRMEIESWDTDPLEDQERIFARVKDTGAPVTGGGEFTDPDYDALGTDGKPVIDIDAHIRLASPEQNNGLTILRRGYNYTDGQDPSTGKLAAGLFFIAFQRDPQTQFKVLQTRLGKTDLLNEYIAHIGGGLWGCPPGVNGPGDWFGKALFT